MHPDLPGRLVILLGGGIGHFYCFLHVFSVLYRVVHFDALNDFWKLSEK